MTAESAASQGPAREPGRGGPRAPLPKEPGQGEPRAPLPPAPPRRKRGRRLRRQPPAEPPLKGRLRMRSPPGAFVLLGISVVLVGMTVAVVGYWPHRGHGGAGASAGNASAAGDVRREAAAGHHVPHSEKLKLIGPVIMGIGLFIFICANTMLYENRDMETRQLMQKGLYGLAVGLPEGPSPEDGHCRRGDSQSLPKASAECVEGCYQVDLSCQPCPGPSSKWSDCYGPNRLQSAAELLQAPAAWPVASVRGLRPAELSRGLPRPAGAPSLLSSAVGALALPIIQLNSCLLDGAARGAAGGPAERPPGAPQPPRAPPSVGGSAAPCGLDGAAGAGDGAGGGGHVTISMGGSRPGAELLLELGPGVHLHAPGHSRSLDLGQPGVLLLAPTKDRRNRSWPRLDRVGCAGLGRAGEPRPSSWVLGVQQGTPV